MANTPDVSFIVHSNDTGTTLVFDWIIDSSSGTRITDPNDVTYITISAFTQTRNDNRPAVQTTYQGDALEAADGTLINTGSITDLSNGIVYVCGMIVGLADDTTITKLSAQNAKVRGGIYNITPAFSESAGDDTVTITFSDDTVNDFETRMANVSTQYPYAGMGAFFVLNPGTLQDVSAVVTNSIPWSEISDNNYSFTVDACNNIAYESWLQLWSAQPFIAGLSVPVAAPSNITPTNLPNPPTDIVTISTIEYNGGTSTSVNVLFNTPAGQDPSTNEYIIYRTDLSSNGYTTISTTQSVGSLAVPGDGGIFSYDGTDYSFNFIDNGEDYPDGTTLSAPVAGKFYGYQIAGVNHNGTGLLSSPLSGVRQGTQASAPSFNTDLSTAGNGSVLLYITASSGSAGGFDLSANTYSVFYTGSDASGTVQGVTPVSIGNLSNGTAYTFTSYAITTNNYYTGPYDVSDNLTESTLSYIGTGSATITLTPYQTAPAPLTASVGPYYDPSGVPGNPEPANYVTWTTSDVSFSGQYLGYSIRSYETSGNVYIDSYSVDPSSAPANKFFKDSNIYAGTQYYYTVASKYIVNNNPVYSVYIPTDNSANSWPDYYVPALTAGQVIPFQKPSAPSLGQVTFNNNSEISFSVTPNSNGGLSSITYRAVADPSGGGTNLFASDVSANVTYDFSANPNTYVKFRLSSRTVGPIAAGTSTETFFSPVTTSGIFGPTRKAPVIRGNFVTDASGILQIDVSNNGAALNFAEGLILDSSGILLVSYGTSDGTTDASGNTVLTPYPDSATFKVTRNDNIAANITVNFNDPDAAEVDTLLIVASNSAGAAVYNNI
jgi:hypothetical protein